MNIPGFLFICVAEKPYILSIKPVFIESMLRTIYGPIFKHENFFWGKRVGMYQM